MGSNVLLMKKAKLKPPLPMPCKLAVTITTFSVNNTKKNKSPKPNSNVLCLRPTPKSLNGELSTKPMLSNVLKNSKKTRKSLLPNFKRWKNSLNPLKLNALLLKRPNNVNSVKSRISKLILNAPTQLLPLLIRNNATSTRFFPNTNKKKKNSKLNSKLPKKKRDQCPLSSSKLKTLMKKLLMVLKLSNANPKTFKKKLLISLIKYQKAANLFMNLKKLNVVLNKNVMNFKPLLKRLKVPLKSKNPRFLDSPSKCLKINKTLKEEWPRKKKKLTTPDATVNALSNPCKPLWILNPKLAPKPSAPKRSLKVTSMISKSNLAMLTAMPLMLKNKSKFFNLRLRMLLPNTMMPNANPKMLLNKWLLSNAAPTSCPVKSKNSATVLNKLNAAVNSLKPNSTNPTNVPTFFTPKTLLLSIKSANSKPNFNKLKEKLKNLSLNAATPKRKLRRLSLMLL